MVGRTGNRSQKECKRGMGWSQLARDLKQATRRVRVEEQWIWMFLQYKQAPEDLTTASEPNKEVMRACV